MAQVLPIFGHFIGFYVLYLENRRHLICYRNTMLQTRWIMFHTMLWNDNIKVWCFIASCKTKIFDSGAFLYARLKNGTYYAVAMPVRPSVRPSVRPRFLDFSSTCFEISIWNLVYTFSRWHDMSSLSCITIGSLWPSLQPKVGQTYFLQSWPHKSR